MTNVCAVCGEDVAGQFSYTCSYCNRKHCSNHRLPEKHDCPLLYGRKQFETGHDGQPPKPAGHRPTESSGSQLTSEAESNVNLVERTKEKQQQRKTHRDELRDRRKE